MVFNHDYKSFPELTTTQVEEMQFSTPHKQIIEDFRAKVVKVHDGDTITLKWIDRNFNFPLRFLDIDAPEINEGGDKAKAWLKNRLIGNIVDVQLDQDNRVGKYGRILGRVFHNGMDVGLEMTHLGLVHEFGRKKEGEVPTFDKLLKPIQ